MQRLPVVAKAPYRVGVVMKKTTNFPPGWDEERVHRLLSHYDSLSEDEAVAEDEARLREPHADVMAIPKELVPAVPSADCGPRQIALA